MLIIGDNRRRTIKVGEKLRHIGRSKLLRFMLQYASSYNWAPLDVDDDPISCPIESFRISEKFRGAGMAQW